MTKVAIFKAVPSDLEVGIDGFAIHFWHPVSILIEYECEVLIIFYLPFQVFSRVACPSNFFYVVVMVVMIAVTIIVFIFMSVFLFIAGGGGKTCLKSSVLNYIFLHVCEI